MRILRLTDNCGLTTVEQISLFADRLGALILLFRISAPFCGENQVDFTKMTKELPLHKLKGRKRKRL